MSVPSLCLVRARVCATISQRFRSRTRAQASAHQLRMPSPMKEFQVYVVLQGRRECQSALCLGKGPERIVSQGWWSISLSPRRCRKKHHVGLEPVQVVRIFWVLGNVWLDRWITTLSSPETRTDQSRHFASQEMFAEPSQHSLMSPSSVRPQCWTAAGIRRAFAEAGLAMPE